MTEFECLNEDCPAEFGTEERRDDHMQRLHEDSPPQRSSEEGPGNLFDDWGSRNADRTKSNSMPGRDDDFFKKSKSERNAERLNK